MASEGIVNRPGIRALLIGTGVVALLQAAFEIRPFRLSPDEQLWLLAAVRLAQAGAVIYLVRALEGGIQSLGLFRGGIKHGFLAGVKWCFGFGAFVGVCMLIIFFAGYDPFFMFRQRLPVNGFVHLASYMFIGSIVAGISEEVFFRGLIYGYLRRYGLLFALVFSTAIFILPHYMASRGAAPFFQGAGGILFALSYEREKHLLAPIILHAGGNFVLFLFTAYFSGQLF